MYVPMPTFIHKYIYVHVCVYTCKVCIIYTHNVHIHTHLTPTYTHILTSQLLLTMALSAHDSDRWSFIQKQTQLRKNTKQHLLSPASNEKRANLDVIWLSKVAIGRKMSLLACSSPPPSCVNSTMPVCPLLPLSPQPVQKWCKWENHLFFSKLYH